MTQLSLNFEPGLTARYKTLEELLAACVYASRGGLQACAAAADQSPSELSRRLNQTDPLPLRVHDMVDIIDETKDTRPVHWCIERWLQDPQIVREIAAQQFNVLMPIIMAYAEQMGLLPPTTSKGKR